MGHEELRELIGKQRTLEILELLAEEGTFNYSDVEQRIPTSSDVVSDRLESLCSYSLVEREEASPKDVRYSITHTGQEFLTRLQRLESLLEE